MHLRITESQVEPDKAAFQEEGDTIQDGPSLQGEISNILKY